MRFFCKTILLTVILLLWSCPLFAKCEHGGFSGGDGSSNNPYIISTVEDLDHVRFHLTSSFKQNNDISVGRYFVPLSRISIDDNGATKENSFKGIYDGNGFGIFNIGIEMNGTANGDWSLFGNNYGTIKNLTMDMSLGWKNPNFYPRIGTFVSSNLGLIENCVSLTNVTTEQNWPSNASYGGIAASSGMSGKFKNCVNKGNVSNSCLSIGGIVGSHTKDSVVENCYNTGNLENYYAQGSTGGIVGRITLITYQFTQVLNSYNVGNISGKGGIGGVVGQLVSDLSSSNDKFNISNCYYLDTSCTKDLNGYGGIPTGIKKSTQEMKNQEFVKVLNGNQGNIWVAGNNTYTYPVFYKPSAISMDVTYKTIGDNTPGYLKIYPTINSDGASILRIINASTGAELYKGKIVTDCNLNFDDDVLSVRAQLLNSSLEPLVNSNVLTIQKNNILNKTLIAANTKTGLQNFIVIDDVDRYFENNATNQKLVSDIKAKASGTFLIYSDVSDVLIPLLKP